MNLADWALRNRTTTLVLTTVMLVGGVQAYQSLSRLEDPEFTIKDALINTPYPGATAAEVEEEISDRIEKGGPAARTARLDRVHLLLGDVPDQGPHQGPVRQECPPAGVGRAAPQGDRHSGRAAARRRSVGGQRRLRRRLGCLLRHLRGRVHGRRAARGGKALPEGAAAGPGRGEDRLLGGAQGGDLRRAQTAIGSPSSGSRRPR